ncbi:hypothetical protein Vadar_018868 [Vaccinium darrowii]|uniref:Uncharacterized protein n=1 Tax=Vaccinium darrowii TaxID=229202 RepID=A0ACB7YWX0_9ERIC|nr:hypothetical protein Vadar_018868 [Vaccinium darrowii]
MAGSAAELDFFRMEKKETSPTQPQKQLFHCRRSFQDIQSVISKLNPEVLKAVIATGSSVDLISKSSENANLLSSTPKHNPFSALPVYSTPSAFWNNGGGNSESNPETPPLTIFYNRTVTVFNVPRHKAENILKIAQGGVSGQSKLLETFNGDLPIARRKSLQRFLEKRKQRLALASPYGCPAGYGFSGKKT